MLRPLEPGQSHRGSFPSLASPLRRAGDLRSHLGGGGGEAVLQVPVATSQVPGQLEAVHISEAQSEPA